MKIKRNPPKKEGNRHISDLSVVGEEWENRERGCHLSAQIRGVTDLGGHRDGEVAGAMLWPPWVLEGMLLPYSTEGEGKLGRERVGRWKG